MKITRVGSAFVLTAALVAGGLAVPSAFADEGAAERYLVTLEAPAGAQWTSNKEVFSSSAASMADVMKRSGIKVVKEYTSVGVISADMTAAQAKALRGKSGVLAVEKNDHIVAEEPRARTADAKPSWVQEGAPWHLDRIDQETRYLDGKYEYQATGKGVTAYVVGNGIYPAWPDIQGRVVGGQDFVGDGYGWTGCHTSGFGTLHATALGGTKYGVAKDVNLYALRVWGCVPAPPVEDSVAAADWVVKNGTHPSVVSHSGSSYEERIWAVEQSFLRVYYAGFPVVSPSGFGDSCNSSPGAVPEVITVAATDKVDRAIDMQSPFGPCIDVFAPGAEIQLHDDTQYNETNPTLAAAMVAGAVAQFLEANPGATPDQAAQAVVNTSFKHRITDPPAGAPSRLLNAYGMSQPLPWRLEVSFDKVKVAGTHAFVWGNVPAGSVAAWTEALTPNGWQKSQTRAVNSQRYFRIPLTYNMHKAGEHRFRVGTGTSKGTLYSEPFTLTRRQLTVTVPSKAKINTTAYLQGKVPTALNRTVRVQVLDNGKWVTTNTVTASATGYVKVPLNWKKGTPGTYTFRAIFNTPYGPVYSKGAKLTRYR